MYVCMYVYIYVISRLYPLGTHHLIEDLDTKWNLYYTHVEPMRWWLEDVATAHVKTVAVRHKNKHKNKWNEREMKYFSEASGDLHVEIFAKDYEYKRWKVRAEREELHYDGGRGEWDEPTKEGHLHRIVHHHEHFALHPDQPSQSHARAMGVSYY